MNKNWVLDEIPWHRFDPAKVDPDMLEAIKAAAMVERDANDYVTYLRSVFHDDPEFCTAARAWGDEELQHGQALGRWARLADPEFDFDANFSRYTLGHQIPLEATQSVRGSRAGELVARCVVEVGTSSFYSALCDATDEPVLKVICHNIAKDEIRHYRLFRTHLQRYCAIERPGFLVRARALLMRIAEHSDDELAYAYYCGLGETAPYSRKQFNRAYTRRAIAYYRYDHVARAVPLILKAVGLNPHGRLAGALSRAGWWLIRARTYQLRHLTA